jgi:hypothetical protein
MMPGFPATRAKERATCAAFIEESRMECIDANRLHRKSGVRAFRRERRMKAANATKDSTGNPGAVTLTGERSARLQVPLHTLNRSENHERLSALHAITLKGSG